MEILFVVSKLVYPLKIFPTILKVDLHASKMDEQVIDQEILYCGMILYLWRKNLSSYIRRCNYIFCGVSFAICLI